MQAIWCLKCWNMTKCRGKFASASSKFWGTRTPPAPWFTQSDIHPSKDLCNNNGTSSKWSRKLTWTPFINVTLQTVDMSKMKTPFKIQQVNKITVAVVELTRSTNACGNGYILHLWIIFYYFCNVGMTHKNTTRKKYCAHSEIQSHSVRVLRFRSQRNRRHSLRTNLSHALV